MCGGCGGDGHYEPVKELARILYAYYERRGDAETASRYNTLVQEWGYIWQRTVSPQQRLVDFSS